MGLKKNSPGCGCCGDCSNCTGDYNEPYDLTISGTTDAAGNLCPAGSNASAWNGVFTSSPGPCLFDWALTVFPTTVWANYDGGATCISVSSNQGDNTWGAAHPVYRRGAVGAADIPQHLADEVGQQEEETLRLYLYAFVVWKPNGFFGLTHNLQWWAVYEPAATPVGKPPCEMDNTEDTTYSLVWDGQFHQAPGQDFVLYDNDCWSFPGSVLVEPHDP